MIAALRSLLARLLYRLFVKVRGDEVMEAWADGIRANYRKAAFLHGYPVSFEKAWGDIDAFVNALPPERQRGILDPVVDLDRPDCGLALIDFHKKIVAGEGTDGRSNRRLH